MWLECSLCSKNCFFSLLPAISFEFPITRTFFDFPWRFELSGVDYIKTPKIRTVGPRLSTPLLSGPRLISIFRALISRTSIIRALINLTLIIRTSIFRTSIFLTCFSGKFTNVYTRSLKQSSNLLSFVKTQHNWPVLSLPLESTNKMVLRT